MIPSCVSDREASKLSKQPKTLPATFYQTATGNELPRVELKDKGFSDNDRILIGRDVARVEFGWPSVVGTPTCEKLDAEIYAVRTNLAGNKIARVLFSPYGGTMFILKIFIKKATDGIKTPQHEIDLAKTRLADTKVRVAAKAKAKKVKKP